MVCNILFLNSASNSCMHTAVFNLWAPRLHHHYSKYIKILDEKIDGPRNFATSVFSCATINFGPNVWTYKHHDVLNLSYGWCAIQALGKFNSTTGGHLILWDIQAVIEFPPASTILIPSACMTHSNIPIQPGESQVSFTQYTAGGIFRWIDNGCQLENDLKKKDLKEFERLEVLKDSRWEKGLALFSTIEEIVSDL